MCAGNERVKRRLILVRRAYRLSHISVHHGRTLEELDDVAFDLEEEQPLPVDGARDGRVVFVQRRTVSVLLHGGMGTAISVYSANARKRQRYRNHASSGI